jgi:hypothetical protein
LINASTGHGKINTGKVPVFRGNGHAITIPDKSTDSNNNLLRVRDVFRRLGKVGNVSNANSPFECRCPKMN